MRFALSGEDRDTCMVQPSEGLFPALVRLKRAVRRNGAETAESVEKTTTHIVALVRSNEGLRISEIGKEMCIDLSTASRHCSELIADGYLERREDPTDRRAGQLYVTEKGRTFIDHIIGHQKKVLNEALSTWSETDIEMLITLVDRLSADLSHHVKS